MKRNPSAWRVAAIVALAAVGVLALTEIASAQPDAGRGGFRDREDEQPEGRQRGRREGRPGGGFFNRGRDDARGGDQQGGGGFRGRGGRGGRGGPFGGGRAGGFEGFLNRMDANGDGALTRGEVPEGRWEMVERIAERVGVSADDEVRIDDLTSAAVNARGRGRDGGRDRRGRGVARRDGDDNPMAFGRPGSETPAVAGFGLAGGGGEQNDASAGESERADGEGEGNRRRRGRRNRDQSESGDSRQALTLATSDSPDSRAKPAEDARDGRRSYRFRSIAERMPDKARGWITQRDRDGDGQVAMHEFSRTWNDSRVRAFQRYDLNGDGIITPAEYVASR